MRAFIGMPPVVRSTSTASTVGSSGYLLPVQAFACIMSKFPHGARCVDFQCDDSLPAHRSGSPGSWIHVFSAPPWMYWAASWCSPDGPVEYSSVTNAAIGNSICSPEWTTSHTRRFTARPGATEPLCFSPVPALPRHLANVADGDRARAARDLQHGADRPDLTVLRVHASLELLPEGRRKMAIQSCSVPRGQMPSVVSAFDVKAMPTKSYQGYQRFRPTSSVHLQLLSILKLQTA